MAFEKLQQNERGIVFRCMQIILDNNILDNEEFQPRLGINKQELFDVVNAWPQLNDNDPNSDTYLAINNCLNEVCYSINIDDNNLEKQFGVSRKDVEQVYNKWKNLTNLD